MSEAFTFIGLAAFSAVEYLVIAIISWPLAFLALAGVLYILKRNGNRVSSLRRQKCASNSCTGENVHKHMPLRL